MSASGKKPAQLLLTRKKRRGGSEEAKKEKEEDGIQTGSEGLNDQCSVSEASTSTLTGERGVSTTNERRSVVEHTEQIAATMI